MKKFFKRVLFFFVVPCFILEITLRLIPDVNNFYLAKAGLFYSLSKEKDQRFCLFMGSSRVAAAILPEIIDTILEEKRIKSFNAGRGMSTSTIYYLALKKLEKEGVLENSFVFLEAPCGFSSCYDTRYGKWIDEANVHLIIPYLDLTTFIEFWKYSSNKFAVKCKLSVNYFSYTVRMFPLFKEVWDNNSIDQLINKFINRSEVVQNENIILARGGIKVDEDAVKAARKFAYSYFEEYAKKMKLIDKSQWEKSRLDDIIKLTKKNNSRLILFNLPVSSLEKKVYEKEISKKNYIIFQDYLRESDITFIDLNHTTYSDEDFPDLWHLSRNKAIEFTNSFSVSILKEI